MDYNVVPNIPEWDKKQGYNEPPIQDVQIKTWDNRKIAHIQYFALYIQGTSWASWDATYRDIVFTGLNGDNEKTHTELFYNGLWSWNELTAKFTKSYTIDTFYESNVSGAGTNTGWIIKIPMGAIVEIQSIFSTATQNLKLNVIAWSYKFLFGTTNIFTSSNTTSTIISSGTEALQIRMQFATSASERPNFWIFIKIYD